MIDRRRRTDLEGVQALGRLADEMVFSLGRAMRSGEQGLDEADLSVLGRAAQLFELLAGNDETIPDQLGGMMFDPRGYLNVLQVVQHRAQGDQLEDYARRVTELLYAVIERRSVAPEETEALERLRALFTEVGETTLARAGELSLPQESHWPPLRQAI